MVGNSLMVFYSLAFWACLHDDFQVKFVIWILNKNSKQCLETTRFSLCDTRQQGET